MNTRIVSSLRAIPILIALLSLSGCPGFRGSLVGIVLDATTESPVCGAIVELRSANRYEQAVSDSNGVFAFLLLPDGEHSVQVVSADGYAASDVLQVSVDSRSSEDAEPTIVEIQLSPGNSGVGEPCSDSRNVAGTVLDAESRAPVCGALVMLSDQTTGEVLAFFIAGADGLFIFSAVEPGAYDLTVLGAEGYSASEPQRITVVPVSEIDTAFAELPEFELNRGEFIPPDADDLIFSNGLSASYYEQFLADLRFVPCARPDHVPQPPPKSLGCGLRAGERADMSTQSVLRDAEKQRERHNAYAQYRADFLIVMGATLMVLCGLHWRPSGMRRSDTRR